jgi:ubiquinone/menaquinone biosynthesis C-methylase UbiE
MLFIRSDFASMKPTATDVSFDEQARVFEARAGLSDNVEADIAAALLAYGAVKADDMIVEIGAGTGEIGASLVRQAIQYIGFDQSAAMLDEFRPRVPVDARAQLVVADANGPWPVSDNAAQAVFGSRVFHLLDIEHTVAEAKRVLCAGGVMISGRIKRDERSPKVLARRKMRELLAAHGLAPRPTEKLRKKVFEQAEALGGVRLEPCVAARWAVTASAAESIAGWRKKLSLGGITPAPEIREEILTALSAWAAETFGAAGEPVNTEEIYVLEGVRFGA